MTEGDGAGCKNFHGWASPNANTPSTQKSLCLYPKYCENYPLPILKKGSSVARLALDTILFLILSGRHAGGFAKGDPETIAALVTAFFGDLFQFHLRGGQ